MGEANLLARTIFYWILLVIGATFVKDNRLGSGVVGNDIFFIGDIGDIALLSVLGDVALGDIAIIGVLGGEN